IALFENNNNIQITYQTFFDYGNYLNTQGAVGITDDQGNFSNRKVTGGINTWPTSIAGTLSSDLCDFTASLAPQGDYINNLVYTWVPLSPGATPPTCPEAYITVNQSYTNGYEYQVGNFYTSLNNAVNVPVNSLINWSDASVTSHQPTTYDVYLDISN